MKKVIAILQELGIKEQEIAIYLASIEGSPSSVIDLSKRTGMKRTNIYSFLDDMVEKGLISPTPVGKKTLYAATEPENLVNILEKQKEKLLSVIPDLSLIFIKSGSKKPKIRFHEGVKGLQEIYEDTLDQEEGSEILAYASFEDVYEIFSPAFREYYLKKRVEKKKIFTKAIARSGKHANIHSASDKDELRETILLPKEDFPVSNEINIYKNKVAILSFGEEKLGVIIESQQIADTQRAIFNSFWKLLKKQK
ncbi:hypothetical protein HYV44_03470 [Candidatus Microgenomates bacterium]|nr:hypothetical protein [Candidatus Microgenomates bacterium]